MASFCSPTEFQQAARLLNKTFVGASQMTLGAQVELGVEMVKSAFRHLTDAQRSEIYTVIDEDLRATIVGGPPVVAAGAIGIIPPDVIAATAH
jgi:hypothetical protein